MLNYEEEIRKFKPSLEVEDIEDAVYEEDLPDKNIYGNRYKFLITYKWKE